MKNNNSKLVKKLEIRDTKKYGKGIYAKEEIKKGSVVYVLDGVEVSETECDKMVADGLINNDDPLQISRDSYLLLDEVSILFNHSCDPNVALSGKSTMVAMKDIESGEQITYDYSVLVPPYNDTFTTMKNCLCCTSKCRKSLGNILTVPKKTVNKYVEGGFLQDFILEALKENNN